MTFERNKVDMESGAPQQQQQQQQQHSSAGTLLHPSPIQSRDSKKAAKEAAGAGDDDVFNEEGPVIRRGEQCDDPAEIIVNSDGHVGEPDDREPSALMQVLLCCVSALEGADTTLLAAVMMALQDDIGVKITDLGYLTVSQAVATNLAGPFWGIMADRGVLQRRVILLLGAMGQGIVTMLLSFVTGVGTMVILRILNGILLASLRPICNGIIADVTSEKHRGKIFGRVQSALLFGMFITSLTAVQISRKVIVGFQGWRVAFLLVGSISIVVSALVFFLMVEPPREQLRRPGEGGCKALLTEMKQLLKFFTMPTFCVMIVQGIFGTIPWSVMGYTTLFFQLCGIDDGQVALLTGTGPITAAIGNMIGGLISDALSQRLGLHGRPLSAQLSVAMGVPLIYLVVQGVPPGSGSFGIYFLLNVAFGLLGSWAQSGTNFPILSHIVPASARSSVMAWECAFENSIANGIGPTVAAQLAMAFGYSFGQHKGTTKDLKSANALGQALAATICLPWLVCFVAYTALHITYPWDIKRLERQVIKDQAINHNSEDERSQTVREVDGVAVSV
eukprot:CAMPEP_0206447122 /NCGR_PEP_ID=MMETSP0324_2-20121206/16584_1 /ASSEMBLY_ACC=CAM_ASM_000836 /TAXON_ID=2866 /ORGANISM="Crypthecodinium cohnii, Strain Seligo" /LENGTH=560 /DNA_ID=CAMNT_0053915805 /DNA_START=66 /DNA_END=1748 /DNA_ORIENTATION=+